MAKSNDSRILGWERRQEILRFVRAHGSATISGITQQVGVSPATLHRDLETLAEQGLIERVYGGAVALEPPDDPPVASERQQRVAEKQQIADAAVERIVRGVNSIFLEASTTIAHMVPALRDLTDKVFVTNSPEIALELATGEVEVMLIGGNLRHRTLSTIGPLAIQAVEAVHIDLAYIGVSALNVGGLTTMNSIEAQTKAALIKAADTAIALSDGTKLGKQALVHVAPLSALSELITDAGAPADEVNRLRAAGLTVTVAEPSSARGAA
ncbi:MAG: DeoR/GlpR family DNA-binding transcription regulator [Propionibacteriaceae bacterium]|jgi:DeoR/GlpR family transcriptional regulator of sugar metabolism|nr:DeoR/GlpR family DNA-binding transcription regulator [Propionibacteriaceae bacterium]